MEPPKGFSSTLWNFIKFLPFFCGLLVLGLVKGIVLCPIVCLCMVIGNSAIILGLWPLHVIWTDYCVLRCVCSFPSAVSSLIIFSCERLGPVLKLVLCICITVFLISWPVLAISASLVGGAAYGLLAPVFSTFDAVGEGRTGQFYHCFYDGTWSTVRGSFLVIKDSKDVCFHSYFSLMDDLRSRIPSDRYEINLFRVAAAVCVSSAGVAVNLPAVFLIALYKTPYMLLKGWRRLLQDLIGREGPFLETICVPFAGLAILLWPLAVVGAFLASALSAIPLGAYAGVVSYQESSIWLGLCYAVASVSLYDEYSNDMLDMPEGSCFPRPRYRKKQTTVGEDAGRPISRRSSLDRPPSRTVSVKASIMELTPLALYDDLFRECCSSGEAMVGSGVIALDRSKKAASDVLTVGLPSYCLLQMLLRSAGSDSDGLLLSDNVTEITTSNRPKDVFFDWFLNPLLVIKSQIKAESLTPAEQDHLAALVLVSHPKNSDDAPVSGVRLAELEALARRLRGMTRSMSRYPTFKRRVESLSKFLSEGPCRRNSAVGGGSLDQELESGCAPPPSKTSTFLRIFTGDDDDRTDR